MPLVPTLSLSEWGTMTRTSPTHCVTAKARTWLHQVCTWCVASMRYSTSVYSSFGIPIADVGGAFRIDSTAPVLSGNRTEPENVAEVCLLTWMCQPPPLGPNIHPNDAGYQTIAAAIEEVLTPW